MNPKIAVIMAMEAEAAPLIEATGLLPLPSPEPRLPFRYFTNQFNGIELILGLNGKDPRYGVDSIGTEPAGLNAYLMIREFKPELMINAGTAGGFRSCGGEIGDVYLSEEAFRYHDRRIPIPRFEDYGIGHYSTLDMSALSKRLGFKSGVVSTSNSLDYTEACLKQMSKNSARVKEMEAAAIAWICELTKTPFFAVKAVTDIVDGEHATAEEFVRNLSLASKNLAGALLRILGILAQPKELSALLSTKPAN